MGGEQVVSISSSYLRGFEIRRHVVFIAKRRASASKARPIIAVYSRFRDICIYIYIYLYICLPARALHKTVHTFRKSYHVGPLCNVLQNNGCCSDHHFEELTTLRSHPFARYGQRRQLS